MDTSVIPSRTENTIMSQDRSNAAESVPNSAMADRRNFLTGVGLAAAIPASIGYNLFVARIRKQELSLNNFASDFLNLAKRNVFKGA